MGKVCSHCGVYGGCICHSRAEDADTRIQSLEASLAEEKKAREEAEFKLSFLSKNIDELIGMAARTEAAESALAALQEENASLKDVVNRCSHEADYSVGESEALAAQLQKVRTIIDALQTHETAKAPWYHSDGTFEMLPAVEVKRKRIAAAKVIEAARAWAKTDTPIRDCSDRDLRHAIDALGMDERLS